MARGRLGAFWHGDVWGHFGQGVIGEVWTRAPPSKHACMLAGMLAYASIDARPHLHSYLTVCSPTCKPIKDPPPLYHKATGVHTYLHIYLPSYRDTHLAAWIISGLELERGDRLEWKEESEKRRMKRNQK